MRAVIQLSMILIIISLAVGCTTTRVSDTSRTGLEQLLISKAVDQMLDGTPLPPVSGRKVFLDTQYLDSVDKGYVIGSLRRRLLNNGAMLTDKKEDSELTLEVCSGGIGTDNVNSFVGIPGMAMPGPLPIQIPEVRMFEKASQFGTAKISLVAYSTANGQLVFDSGSGLARSDDNRWSLMGVGPFQTGSVRDDLRTANSRRAYSSQVANSAGETNLR
jgi:hypothetical protein